MIILPVWLKYTFTIDFVNTWNLLRRHHFWQLANWFWFSPVGSLYIYRSASIHFLSTLPLWLPILLTNCKTTVLFLSWSLFVFFVFMQTYFFFKWWIRYIVFSSLFFVVHTSRRRFLTCDISFKCSRSEFLTAQWIRLTAWVVMGFGKVYVRWLSIYLMSKISFTMFLRISTGKLMK